MLVIIQIPCLNEETTLPKVLADLPTALTGVDQIEVLVIDDGSTDSTAAIASKHNVQHVIRLERKQGLANAFSVGVRYCIDRGANIIVNTDGDHQYPGGRIAELIEPIVTGRADIVIGDRQPARDPQWSLTKRILYKAGRLVVSKACGCDFPDPTSGFRAMNAKAARQIQIKSRFSYTIESLMQAVRLEFRVLHLRIQTNVTTRPSRLASSTFSFVWQSAFVILKQSLLQFTYRTKRFFLLPPPVWR